MNRIARAIGLIGLSTLVGVSIAFSFPRMFIGDIAVFVGAGRLAALGQNPYGIAAITPRGPDGVPFPNLSPPISVLVFQQIAWLDPGTLFRVFYAVNLVLYVTTILFLSRSYPSRHSMLQVLWALAIFPVWFTVAIGQVQVILLLLSAAAWLALQRGRNDVAGVALGVLMAWKPNFLLWPVFLFLAGRRRAALVAAAAAALLSLWPALVYGPAIYLEWLDASARTTAGIGGYGTISFLTHDLGIPWFGVPLSVALVLGATAWAWRTRTSSQRVGEVALIVSLLALPITNTAYFVLLVPIFFARPWKVATFLSAFLLLFPWTLIIGTRVPWPYALVLVLLLDDLPIDRKLSALMASTIKLRLLARVTTNAGLLRNRPSP